MTRERVRATIARGPCKCGCRETPAGRTSAYMPGHDRRHVEQYVTWWTSAPATRNSRESIQANAARTFSPALYAEFLRRIGYTR